MITRFAKLLAASLIAIAVAVMPVYAQKGKNQPPPKPTERKPVVEYIGVVVLLAVPIGLICRSSRRST